MVIVIALAFDVRRIITDSAFVVRVVGGATLAWAWAGGGCVGATLASSCAGVIFPDADDGRPFHEEVEEGRWREVFVTVGGVRGCVSAETTNPAFGAGVAPGRGEFEEERGVGLGALGPQEALRFGTEGKDGVEDRDGVATYAGEIGCGESVEETEGEFCGATVEGIGVGMI